MLLGSNVRSTLELFRFFITAYPGRSALTLLALTASAMSEGLSIAAVLPLIGIVIGVEGTGGALTAYVERVFGLFGHDITLVGLLVLIVIALTLKAVLLLIAMTQVGFASAHVVMDLRLTCIRALLRARWEHFVEKRTGELTPAIGGEPGRSANAYVACCRMMSSVIQLLVYLGLSIAISWEVLVVALAVGGLGIVLLNRLVTISQRAGERRTELVKSFMTRLLQGLYGMKPLKAMALEGSIQPLIEGDVRGLNKVSRTIIVTREALAESQDVIRAFAMAGGIYVFVAVLAQPIEELVVFALLFGRTLGKVNGLQRLYQTVANNQPAFAFVRATIAEAEQAREPGSGGKSPTFGSAISLRQVSFSYGRENVLDGISMTLPAGSFIAVVGSSGAGKTTVADLIIGLLRPQQGDVWIDDTPLGEIDLKAWRGMIGYVLQDTFLFHDTVMANVVLGDAGISRERVEQALRRAESWEFVSALPEGMDTVVGERGAKLSGGQRQRIAIARALVREPALLILDEATTALDPETEAGIVATIRRLAGKVTVLSISHQPALQRAADRAYLLEGRTARLLEPDEAIGMQANTA